MSTATASSPARPTSPVASRSAGQGRVAAPVRRTGTRRRAADAKHPQQQLTDDYIDRYGTFEVDSRTVLGVIRR